MRANKEIVNVVEGLSNYYVSNESIKISRVGRRPPRVICRYEREVERSSPVMIFLLLLFFIIARAFLPLKQGLFLLAMHV